MIEGFLGVIDKIINTRTLHDDDFSDRISHQVSMFIFLGFATASTLKQYVGDPLKCWMPAEFVKSMRQYAENYCFISHMYRVPWEEGIAWEQEKRFALDISFYRWVPVIFLFIAFMFKLPNVFWEMLKGYSGIDVKKIVGMAEEAIVPDEDRETKLANMGYFMDRWLGHHRGYHNGRLAKAKTTMSGVLFCCFGRRTGTYMTGLYLCIKLLYCVNVVALFFILSGFLGFDFATYGFHLLRNLNSHGEFKDLENFPRIVFCDFDIRQLNNVQRYTIQCTLSINLFTEKMFAITWFWLVIVAVASFYSLIKWCIFIFLRRNREHFIQNYLGLLAIKKGAGERTLFRSFVTDYLRDDGVLMIKAVYNNTNPMITLDIVEELWRRFKVHHEELENDKDA